MTYKGIVFDKDGTLIDFNSTWLPVYRYAALEVAKNNRPLADELLNQHGYDPDASRFIGGSLLAVGNNHAIAHAWARHLVDVDDETEIETLSVRLNQLFQQQVALSATPVQGLKATLQHLTRAGLKLGVATSDSYQGIHNTLEAFDVISEFEFLCGYDSGHGLKPDPGMVLAFCAAMSLEPAEVIVVGDNRHDIEMGKNARAGYCIGVLTGTSTRDELEDLADVVFDDITDLVQLISG
ncbi:MAG: HAD family hydrolase [Gammaproteobacteria bacterium]|nr:HAD family hydrolase [Gammaproteobacteria bacterium]